MAARLSILLFLLFSIPATAQDLHFSQFYHHPQQVNPAAAGSFSGTWRVAGLYRSQWASVPVDYRTFAVAFDSKLLMRGVTQFSGGLVLERDQAGDAGLSWTQVGVSASAARPLGENQRLGIGIGLAGVQRAFDIGKLKFRNQWTGDIYDATWPTGEPLGPSSGLAPTLSAGLWWHYATADTRTFLDAGIGAAHLNRPVISFHDDARAQLPARFNLLLDGAWQLNDLLDVVAFGSAQQMSKNREIVGGAGLRRVLTTGPANATAVRFSLAVRTGDALIPALQLERNNWTVGLSYDWNTSGFQTATRHRGGFEIAVVYRQVPVPPLPIVKSCPIF